MFKANKLPTTIWLMLALIACIALTLAGCSGNEPTAVTPAVSAPTITITTPPITPTPLTAQEIVSNTVNKMSQLTSVRFSLYMKAQITGTTDNQPLDITVTSAGEGLSDIAAHQSQINLETEMESANQTKISSPMDLYLVDGWLYIKMTSFTGEQWLKMKVPENSYASGDQSAQALEMLKTAVSVTLLGVEDVDGEACYILEVTPDLDQISEWLKLNLQAANFPSEAMANLDIGKFVKNLSIKEAVTRDSLMLKKCDVSATITIEAADFGETEDAGESVTMVITSTLSMDGYNQPVTITLPAEAADARDMSGMKPGLPE